MKDIGLERIVLSLFTGVLILLFGIYVVPREHHFLSVLLPFLCAVVNMFRWMIKYDKFDPKADIFGIGFTKRRFPVFIENQSKMNALTFNTYKWFLICIILLFCGNR